MPEQSTTLNSSVISNQQVNVVQKPRNNKKIIIILIIILVLLPVCTVGGYTAWMFLQLGRAAAGQIGDFPIITGDKTLPLGFPKYIPLTSDAILMMKVDNSNKSTGKVLISITYETKQSPKDIQSIYDTALFNEGWYVDEPSDNSNNIEYLYYRKGAEKLMVIINGSTTSSLISLTYQK